MKITELIAELKRFEAVHGDIDVIVPNNSEYNPVECVPFIYYGENAYGDEPRIVLTDGDEIAKEEDEGEFIDEDA